MKKHTRSIASVGLAALATTALVPMASAETIKITIAAPAPGIVTYVKMATTKFIPAVNKRLEAAGKGFKIRWVKAYGSSLAKPTETLEAVEENIAQMGLLVKNFEEAKLPLGQYPVMAPFTAETVDQIITIDENIRKKVPAMNEVYRKLGQEFLVSGVSPQYDLFTTFPVKSIDDLKGRKIGVSGVLGQFFRGTAAVTVSSAMINSFTSIRSGVYEGYPISIALSFPFKTYEAAKQYTRVNFGVSGSTCMTVNSTVWKKFPDYVKTIFREEAAKWPAQMVAVDKIKIGKFSKIMKKKGVKFNVMAESERQRWANAMPNIAKEWSERQEKKGLPGKAVMAAYFTELRAMNVKMLREWDKE